MCPQSSRRTRNPSVYLSFPPKFQAILRPSSLVCSSDLWRIAYLSPQLISVIGVVVFRLGIAVLGKASLTVRSL